MSFPNWRKLAFSDGVLLEAVPDDQRIVFWLPEVRYNGVACMERIATVAGGETSIEQGIGAVAATGIRARRLGVLGHLWQRFRPESEAQVWTLPNGKTAEQVGGRCYDLVLAWAEDEAVPLDESRIKSRWPQSRGIQKIAENLYLVRGVELQEQIGSEEATVP